MAWHAALLRPDRFDAVAALSVHWGGIAPRPTPSMRPTDAMRAALGDSFLYILYFQEPGVAESELDVDLRRSLRCFLYELSGDIPRDEYRFFDPTAHGIFDILAEPPGPLDWLSDDDLDVFVDSFAHHGTFFGGLELVPVHRPHQRAVGAVRRATDHAARALHRCGVRLDLRPDTGVGARDRAPTSRTSVNRSG